MHASRNAATCLWAVPTLFLRAPFWFEAENAPWCVLSEPALRVMNTTDPCASCPHWEPQRVAAVPGDADRVVH